MKISEFRDGGWRSDVRVSGPPVVRHARNADGRDFVVGDLHGMFRALERLLAQVRFDPAADRVFSVGDLVDRGPESTRALEWLARPWFHACRGNHEQFAIDSVDEGQFELWVEHNGGDWWLDVDDVERERYLEAFRALPLAMEVETDTGAVGIVHADVPALMPWEQFAALLADEHIEAALYAMWSRNRAHGNSPSAPVGGGVSRVYCGHTPTRGTLRMDNVLFIDTGAVYADEGFGAARLTLIEIQPGPETEHGLSTVGLGRPEPTREISARGK